MGALDSLLDQVKQAITQHTNTSNGSLNSGSFIDHITDLFSKHPHNNASNPRPASQDPYGDPGAQSGAPRNVRPASQDPYGDPADK